MTSADQHDPSPDLPDEELAAAHDTLERATESLRDAIRRLHDAEDRTWRRYAADTEEALDRLRADLAVNAAELRAGRSQDKADLEGALHQAGDALRGRAEEVRVRAHIAGLDARDVAGRAWGELERAGHALGAALSDVRAETTTFTAGLRDRTTDAIGVARRALLRIAPVLDPRGAAEDGADDDVAR